MKTPITCDLKAIPPDDRDRHHELSKRLRAALHDARELEDGYEFRLDQSVLPAKEFAEWAALELLCCPFLKLILEGTGRLQITGPDQAKTLIRAEFGTTQT